MTVLENPMVIGDYYAAITDDPIYDCPRCHHTWYDAGDGWSEDGDGEYPIYHGNPAHGKGCVGCTYKTRTQQDAMAYALEQGESGLREILKAIVEDVGAWHVLQMIGLHDNDMVMQTASDWADDQDEYMDWIINHKQ